MVHYGIVIHTLLFLSLPSLGPWVIPTLQEEVVATSFSGVNMVTNIHLNNFLKYYCCLVGMKELCKIIPYCRACQKRSTMQCKPS